jgi:hypothetical protein
MVGKGYSLRSNHATTTGVAALEHERLRQHVKRRIPEKSRPQTRHFSCTRRSEGFMPWKSVYSQRHRAYRRLKQNHWRTETSKILGLSKSLFAGYFAPQASSQAICPWTATPRNSYSLTGVSIRPVLAESPSHASNLVAKAKLADATKNVVQKWEGSPIAVCISGTRQPSTGQ